MAERLTHERCSGIKTGYWSPAKKQELVNKLAEFENLNKLPAEICDNYCRYPRNNMDADSFEDICRTCPVNDLAALLD